MRKRVGLIDAVEEIRAELQAIALEMLDLADAREKAFGVKAEIEYLRRSADIIYHLENPLEGMSEAERNLFNRTKIFIEDPIPNPDQPFMISRIEHASRQVREIGDIIAGKKRRH